MISPDDFEDVVVLNRQLRKWINRKKSICKPHQMTVTLILAAMEIAFENLGEDAEDFILLSLEVGLKAHNDTL